MIEWEVAEEEAGERLDRAVAARLEAPRNQVQRWIREGRVTVDGRPARPSSEIVAGVRVACERPPAPTDDPRIVAEAGELAVIHEDSDLLVLDKPAGLTVHPGAGRATGTLVHRLLGRYPQLAGVGGEGRPGIVHRLDAGTSGLLAVALTPLAYQRLSADFAARRVGKQYLAIAHGVPREPSGHIAEPIGRHPEHRKEMAVRRGGRPAVTDWRTLGSAGGCSLLEVDLGTGRTHQIRVHLKHVGHPLVGDPVYGEARWKGSPRAVQALLRDFPRPALHAWRLQLDHPRSGERLRFEAPWPEDLRRLWAGLGGNESRL